MLLDAEGRPLLHERVHDGYVLALWRYDGDRTEEVSYSGGEPHVTWMLGTTGAVGAELSDRWAERWSWRNDQLVRVDRGGAAPGGWALASATEAELDAGGGCAYCVTGAMRPTSARTTGSARTSGSEPSTPHSSAPRCSRATT